MQSLIWNKVGDEKANGTFESPYNGSPLDYLPCPPSKLLYTYDYYGVNKRTKQYVKNELEKAELCIKRRSLAVENKWATDKLKQASIGIFQTKILAILDILDKHCYDLTDINDSIELLYAKIFPKIKLSNNKNSKSNGIPNGDIKKENQTGKEGASANESSTSNNDTSNLQNGNDKEHLDNEGNSSECNDVEDDDEDEDDDETEIKKPLTDREIIHLLCDWATTTKRCGIHRLFYVVFLIKKRQIDLISQFREANEDIADVRFRYIFFN